MGPEAKGKLATEEQASLRPLPASSGAARADHAAALPGKGSVPLGAAAEPVCRTDLGLDPSIRVASPLTDHDPQFLPNLEISASSSKPVLLAHPPETV